MIFTCAGIGKKTGTKTGIGTETETGRALVICVPACQSTLASAITTIAITTATTQHNTTQHNNNMLLDKQREF